MIRFPILKFCVLACTFTVCAADTVIQGTKSTDSTVHYSESTGCYTKAVSGDTAEGNDDTFERCSKILPGTILKLIAQYCIGSQQEGVCPLLIKALSRRRVIADCPDDISKFTIHLCDSSPHIMMLSDYRPSNDTPIIDTFNFETGEHILDKNEPTARTIDSSSDECKALLPHNGLFAQWTCRADTASEDLVFTRYTNRMIPHYQTFPSEEHRVNQEVYEGIVGSGIIQQWQGPPMELPLLQHKNGSFFIRWIFSAPPNTLPLHPNPEEQPLEELQNIQRLIASEDCGCIGIVYSRKIILFDGITGDEIMRCMPPKDFHFRTYDMLGKNIYLKICSIPIHGKQRRSHYELIAAVIKRMKLPTSTTHARFTENRYICWDAEEKRIAQDIYIRQTSTGILRGGHILNSGAFMAMYRDLSSKLIVCDPAKSTVRTVWDFKKNAELSEFESNTYSMAIAPTGSCVLFYGRSRMQTTSPESQYGLCATMLHFDPTVLYNSDVLGITDQSLLQRIRLLHGLCLAAYEDKPVQLTIKGKQIFETLHSQVRCNLQTTMPLVNGWAKESSTLNSQRPILSSLKKREKDKEQNKTKK